MNDKPFDCDDEKLKALAETLFKKWQEHAKKSFQKSWKKYRKRMKEISAEQISLAE